MDILQKNKLLAVLVSVLIIINLALLASFWIFHDKHESEPPKKEKKGTNNIIEFFKNELSFNQEQSDSLKILYDNYQLKNEDMHEEIRKIHIRINDNVLKNKSASEIKSEFELLGNKKADLDKVSYEFFLNLRSLCREEQIGKFDDLFKDIIRLINKPPQKK